MSFGKYASIQCVAVCLAGLLSAGCGHGRGPGLDPQADAGESANIPTQDPEDHEGKPVQNAPSKRPDAGMLAERDAGAVVDPADASMETADAATPDDAGTEQDAGVADAGDDSLSLRIIDSQPSRGGKGVSPTARVTITWSAPLAVDSIASVTLRDELGDVVAGTFLVPGDDQGGFYDETTSTYYPAPLSDNVFVFLPSARFTPGARYALDFGNLQGQSGEPLRAGEAWSFTVLDPVQIAAGGIHNLLLDRDGSVWGWGGSVLGEAGSGATSTSVYAPARVLGLTGYGSVLAPAKQVAASEHYSLALLKNGTVCAWGNADLGRLGDGQTYASNSGSGVPVQVAGLTNVTAVAAGATFALALKSDGTVWAWGAGGQGQLGTGAVVASSNVPVQVHTSGGLLSKVTAIAAGGSHALALIDDGSVMAWGDAAAGQTGTSGEDVLVATPVQGLANIKALAARNAHSLALDTTGKVYQWGANEHKVGGGITWSNVVTPTVVPFPEGTVITTIRAGYLHSLAASSDGTLYSWGLDYYGELFGPVGVDRPTPQVALSLGSSLVDFGAGGAFLGAHSIYILEDAQVIARGSSKHGQTSTFP